MYAPTAPNTMSGKGLARKKKKKKVAAFTHQGTRTFWKCILVKFCPVDGSLFGSWLFICQEQKQKVPNWERNGLGLQEGQV